MAGAKAFPVNDVNELIEVLRRIDLINPVVRYMLEFSSRTGLRYVDVSQLKWTDVMINGVYRNSFDLVQSKSYNRRITNGMSKANARAASAKRVDLTDEIKTLLEELREFTGDRKLLFQSTHHHAKNDRPISINYVNTLLKRVATELNLPYQLSTHSMRKTFARFLIEDEATMDVLMRALGQSSLSSTQHYIDTFMDRTKEYTGKISFSVN